MAGGVNLLRRIASWLRPPDVDREFPRTLEVGELHDVPYDLDPRVIYIAGMTNLRKWAVFACPCDRPHRVTLSLQLSHRPHWSVRVRAGRATIFPSVNVRDLRRCHYTIRDGRVQWVPHWLEREAASPQAT